MNLQPLYDLKERLEAAAIAGTSLLSEDFRLARAAEGLAPLAAASPVFAKIKAGLDALLAAKKEEQPGRLLSLLALVDAVAYTQGAAGAAGELEPLAEVSAGGGRALPLSYGQLHPLLEALTGSGGGRMNTIKECREEHPDYFEDYRVLPLLVKALEDSYADIAEIAGQILLAQGETALPLLKDGFDPAGKKEMARRAKLVSEIGGAGENDFYLANLPNAKKPVRGELIYALRHCPANGELLQNLAGTERGENKDMAEWALARVDAPEGAAYLETLAQKDPDRLLDRVRSTYNPTADRLLGEVGCQVLDALTQKTPPFTPQDQARLETLRYALRGKAGPGALAVYRKIAALGTALDGEVEQEVSGHKKRGPMEFYCFGATSLPNARRPFSRAAVITLLQSIQQNAAPSLCALADELSQTYGEAWAAPALCAALLTQPAGKAYEAAEALLPRARLRLFGGKNQSFAQQGILEELFFGLRWEQDHGQHEYTVFIYDPVAQIQRIKRVPLAAPLDPRWLERMMDAGGPDLAIDRLMMPGNTDLGQKFCRYLHEKTMSGSNKIVIIQLIPILLKHGWKDWIGLLPAYYKTNGTYNFYQVVSCLNGIPLTDAEKAAELRKIDKTARSLGSSRSWPALAVERQLEIWEK